MNLFLGNLPITCNESHLEAVFEEYGFRPTNMRIVRTASRAFSFVEIEGDAAEVEAVIQKLRTIELGKQNRRIIAHLAKDQRPQAARMATKVDQSLANAVPERSYQNQSDNSASPGGTIRPYSSVASSSQ